MEKERVGWINVVCPTLLGMRKLNREGAKTAEKNTKIWFFTCRESSGR